LKCDCPVSTIAEKLSYLVGVFENLKIGYGYDGFLFLVESTGNPPRLQSQHYVELEMNLVAR